jgi:hypothetical protein
MSETVPGTTRYLCPLECCWHHDVPPVSLERLAELGAAIDPAALDVNDVTSFARQAYLTEARQTDAAAREHLATHTTEQFVTVIHDLRVEVAALRERPVSSEEHERMSARDRLWHLYQHPDTASAFGDALDDYAHELAEKQRASGRDDYCTGIGCCGEHGGVADLIDPKASKEPTA